LICDGNGRWATQRNLPRAAGHLVGARRLVDLIRSLVRERQHQKQKQNRKQAPRVNVGIVDCLTLYAFSTENWTRCPSEIAKIFDAIEFAATAVHTAGDLAEIDLRVLGDLSDERIPSSLRNVLSDLEEKAEHRRESGNSDRLQVCLAVNYGGRTDIVSACRSLASAVQNGSLEASDISEAMLESRLSTGGIPSPDLIVRTGGEHRLSNFLLWEAAYAELFVSSVLWPDFSWEGEWKRSLDWYSKRKRNFGGRGDDDEAGEQP
jgi:undecaprenyl diphosphate synthase